MKEQKGDDLGAMEQTKPEKAATAMVLAVDLAGGSRAVGAGSGSHAATAGRGITSSMAQGAISFKKVKNHWTKQQQQSVTA